MMKKQLNKCTINKLPIFIKSNCKGRCPWHTSVSGQVILARLSLWYVGNINPVGQFHKGIAGTLHSPQT